MPGKKYKDRAALAAAVLVCGTVFASTFYVYRPSTDEEPIFAHAEAGGQGFRWEKLFVDEGTTVDADYLWPDEENPEFTDVYRDGIKLDEDKMVTVTPGSVYHFRGKSGNKTLYTQIYPGRVKSSELTGESATWYRLVPSAIRAEFEQDGWTWETGPSYDDRAHLDKENKKIVIVEDDATAVLYGLGLYLDDIHDYKADTAFEQEKDIFTQKFGKPVNAFARAMECYYTKGGELRSICPKIYAMVAESLSQLDTETAQICENIGNTVLQEEAEKPVLMTELLEYVNSIRTQNGLTSVSWDAANDDNIKGRATEVAALFSETRPDGSDSFSAYTDAVMSEVRVENALTATEIYECAASYFMMPELLSFACAAYKDKAVIVFVW